MAALLTPDVMTLLVRSNNARTLTHTASRPAAVLLEIWKTIHLLCLKRGGLPKAEPIQSCAPCR